MRLKDLAKYEMPELIINAWSNRQGDYLLPLQEKAIHAGLINYQIDNGCANNLLISAPTSSGKSFCGEMAAISALLKRKKAVMLIPLKSIAEEKYNFFHSCYQPLGIKTIIVTRDHPDNDYLFEMGDFDFAVAIYEKFNRLLTANIDILQQLGLIIIDELQLLGDAERGPELEMALTKIITSGYKPKIIALSAVLDDEEELARWLNCRIIKETARPVDLLQGVASDGHFHYRSFNNGIEGSEKFDIESNPESITESLINFLRSDRSQKLIFLKSKRDTINAAFKLAASVDWGEAKSILTQLDEEEPSFLIRSLRQVLSHGIAFHNADLTPSQRQAVEQGYINGEIRILFSTTTLAMGVNLPAETVLLETMKYDSGIFGGKPALIPITSAEFQNITGRAGRFGFGSANNPGKAIILASSSFEHEVLWTNYIETHHNAKIVSCLDRFSLHDIILDIVASRLVDDFDTLLLVLSQTFYAHQKKPFERITAENILSDLKHIGLIGDDYSPTSVGFAVAECGLSYAGYQWYKKSLENQLPDNISGWLFFALSANDFTISRSGLLSSEYHSHYYERLLYQKFDNCLGTITPLLNKKIGSEPLDFRSVAILKATFLLTEWAQEIPVEQLEQRYQLHHGQIINLGEIAAWLMMSLAKIIRANDHKSVMPLSLEDFAFNVQFGISSEIKELHAFSREILSRFDFANLRKEGIKTIGDFRGLPPGRLAELIKSENKLKKLYELLETPEKEEKMNRTTALNTGYNHPITLGAGLGYRPSSLELDGNYVGERYLVKIDGFPVHLTGKSFKYLTKLAYSRLANGEGWIYKDDIEAGFNQARYLYRLKQEVNHDGGCPWDIFENNRLGYYRLALEPNKIKLNIENLKSHSDYELRHMAESLAPRLIS
jgi:helicase